MNTEIHFETLDPENWDEMRALSHRMVDNAITYIETVGKRPVWQPVPDDVATRFDSPVPHEHAGADAVYNEFLETVFPLKYIAVFRKQLNCWGWAAIVYGRCL